MQNTREHVPDRRGICMPATSREGQRRLSDSAVCCCLQNNNAAVLKTCAVHNGAAACRAIGRTGIVRSFVQMFVRTICWDNFQTVLRFGSSTILADQKIPTLLNAAVNDETATVPLW